MYLNIWQCSVAKRSVALRKKPASVCHRKEKQMALKTALMILDDRHGRSGNRETQRRVGSLKIRQRSLFHFTIMATLSSVNRLVGSVEEIIRCAPSALHSNRAPNF